MPEGTTVIGVDGDGVVSLLGVGTTVVHATVHDTSNAYADSHAYVVVTVLPKSVTATTQSATKAYDGTPLTADGTCEELVGGDVFKTIGMQTNAGSSTNTYTITKEGTDVSATANYNITESLGTLKVTRKPTTVDLKLSQSGSSATARQRSMASSARRMPLVRCSSTSKIQRLETRYALRRVRAAHIRQVCLSMTFLRTTTR